MRSIRRIACGALLALVVQENGSCLHAGEASFTGLGDFAGGRYESAAGGISPDGTVVSGYGYDQYGNQEAFRWTAETGLIGLGDLPGGETWGDPASVSAYGKVIVGDSRTDGGLLNEGFVWSVEGGMIGLTDLGGGKLPEGWGTVWSRALDVSWDGQVVAGVANGANGFEAFKWTAADGMVGLGDLEGGYFESGANGVSADGLVIVGLGSRDRTEATRWTEEEGIRGLGFIESDDLWSVATKVSADGRVIIGLVGHLGGDVEAFRWTEADGMVGLGDLSGGVFDSEADGVSADGSVIVGYGSTGNGQRAFIWDADHGMRELRDVLVSDYGLAATLGRWVLESAYAVSADGRRIVGWGKNSRGQKEAFLVVLPQEDPAPTSRLSNLSVRTSLTDDQTLITGLVRAGGEAAVLFRAAGPALSALGVGIQGAPDPFLTLHDGPVTVAENDSWSASLVETFDSLGAFPFAFGSMDAALFEPISGARTLHASGGGEGVVLVEAYDTATDPAVRLVNLSARNHVGSGQNALIAGFVVSGSGTQRVLVRGVGPGLARFGIDGVIENPILELHDGGDFPLLTNDDWEASLSDEAALLGAFSLDRGSRDAALMATVEAGKEYTVVLKDADGGEGEGLIEVYAIEFE